MKHAGIGFMTLLGVALVLAAPVADAGLLSYWNFDDGTGSSTAANYTGGPVGYLRNMDANTAWVPGRFGTALNFTAADDWVDVTQNVPETDVTVSMWVKTTTPTGGFYSVNNPERGGENDRNYWFENGNIRTRIWSEETTTSTPPPGESYIDDAWHHVVHQYGAAIGGQRTYVDGQLRASGAKSFSNFDWQTHVEIGWCNQAGSFNGQIDDVAIWDKVLTPSQIQNLASGLTAPPDIPFPYPVAELKLRDASIRGKALVYDPNTGTSGPPDSYKLEIWETQPGANVEWFLGNQNWTPPATFSYVTSNAYPSASPSDPWYGPYPISNVGTMYSPQAGTPHYPDEFISLYQAAYGSPPGNQDNYSIRYTGMIYLDPAMMDGSGQILFGTNSDDPSWLTINGQPVLNFGAWTFWDTTPPPGQGGITLAPGWYPFDYTSREGGGGDCARLRWWDPVDGQWEDIPNTHLDAAGWRVLADIPGTQVGDLLSMGDFGRFGLLDNPDQPYHLRLTVYGAGTQAIYEADVFLVPEPATMLLLAGGLLALARRRRVR